MTLTSIGYGEMLPALSNYHEQFLCVLLMLGSSMVWVYMCAIASAMHVYHRIDHSCVPSRRRMGQMCAIASTMDPDTTQFRNSLDALNSFMRDRGLNPEARNCRLLPPCMHAPETACTPRFRSCGFDYAPFSTIRAP